LQARPRHAQREKGYPNLLAAHWVHTVAFLALVFGLVFWQIEPPLQFHARSPIFFTGQDYLWEFLDYPGGPVHYLASFLQQFYQQPWAGAAVTTFLTWGVCGLIGSVLRPVAGSWTGQIRWLAALPLLLTQSRYVFPWMEFSLALLGALAATVLYLGTHGRRPAVRAGCFLVLAIPLFYLVGGLFLGFALWCALVEVLRSQSWRWRSGLGLGFAVMGGLLPWLASRTVFLIPTAQAYGLWLPHGIDEHRSWAAVALLAAITLAIICRAGSWFLRVPTAVSLARRAAGRRSGLFMWEALQRPPRVWAAGFIGTIAVAGFFALWDGQAKLRVQVDFHSHHRQWETVLALAPRVASPDPAVVSDINRALAHTGRLITEMFSHPQRDGMDFWFYLRKDLPTDRLIKASDLLFDLGQINRAERMAGEAMEFGGYRPAVLQRLALIQVLKGEPQSARLFLHRLARTLTHRAWARRTLAELEHDPDLLACEETNAVRPFVLRTDYVGDYGTEALLYQVLQDNLQNRLAFEYLIAHYLLTQQPERTIPWIGQLNRHGYTGIPRHHEEGILLHQWLNKDQVVNLHGHHLNPHVAAEFRRFNQQLRIFGTNVAGAMPALRSEFGHTYWYYYMFGCSGALPPPTPAIRHP
jgi:hypothetical protein